MVVSDKRSIFNVADGGKERGGHTSKVRMEERAEGEGVLDATPEGDSSWGRGREVGNP